MLPSHSVSWWGCKAFGEWNSSFLKNWLILAIGFMGVQSTNAAHPIDIHPEVSLEEEWRWTELEGLGDFGFRFAAAGNEDDVWFARKNGVARYDGFQVECFDFEALDDVGTIVDLHVSRQGHVYLLSDRHLATLKEGTWSVEEVVVHEGSFGNAICEDARGNIWFVGVNGVYRSQGSTTVFFNLGFELASAAIVDSQDRLWVADVDRRLIEVFDVTGDEADPLATHTTFEIGDVPLHTIKLSVASNGDVLVIDNIPTQGCLRYRDYKEIEDSRPVWFNRFWGYSSIAEAPEGRFWIASGSKLSEWPIGGEIQVHDAEKHPIPTSYGYVIAISGDRLLIGGKASKIYMIDLSVDRWTMYPELIFQCEDESGKYWFLDHDGRIVSHDPETEEWLLHDRSGDVLDRPNRIFCGDGGILWASGSNKGMAAVSYLKEGSWHLREFVKVGTNFSHLGVLEAADGSIILGAGNRSEELPEGYGGAVVFRREADQLTGAHVAPPIFPKRTATLVDRAGDGLWFGATSLKRQVGGGFLAPEKIDLLEDNWIDHLMVDRNNDLWVASWGVGIYQYDGEHWILHNESNGLGTNQVSYLHEGKIQEGIWALTSLGLNRFDGHSWSSWDFPVNYRHKRESNTLHESSDGSLWINYSYRSWYLEMSSDAGRQSTFRSVRYQPDHVAPKTRIIEHNRDYPEGSQVEINWVGRDSWSDTPAEELEYSWRLNGNEWSPFSRERSKHLGDLMAGDHVFEVRARDKDWNIELNPSKIEIAVIAPLWKRPWFILLMLLVFSVLIFLTIALVRARLKAALAMDAFRLDFFTNISHELLNPLAVIVGPIESLLAQEKSPNAKEKLQLALRNVRKMEGLVIQLLQFRKVELGKSKYTPRTGELIGFVIEALDNFVPLAKSKGQNLVYRTAPNYLECSFDADKLQKIIDNLVSNAIKYSETGNTTQVCLSIATDSRIQECILAIEDEGRGIPSDEIDLVLRPFYRGNRKASNGQGFGIGLAYVSQLVQLWGGEISLESPITPNGKGTRVTVRLPLAVAEAIDETKQPIVIDTDDVPDTSLGTDRILVVEDNADLRTFITNELRDRFDVLEAENGRQGFEIAINKHPDLLISDVMMPEMDGLEFCRKIRANRETSHIPIVLLTARGSEEHIVEGIKEGADEYLAKPVNMVRLSTRIDSLLESRRRLKESFSKTLVIEPTKLTVSSVDEGILKRAIEVVEKGMQDESFDVDHFASEMGMSRASLYRKIKALTGEGPSSFIKSMRLKRAAQLLGSGMFKISDVLTYIGILDQSYFSRVFKQEFGVAPTTYAEGKSQVNTADS